MSGDGANPLTLSQAELLDVMEASGGYVCFVYLGVAWATFFRWHPDLDQYEALTVKPEAELLEGGAVMIGSTVTDHWALTPSTAGEFLPEKPTALTDARLEPIRYERTPFDEAGVPEETWSPEQAEGSRVT